MTENARKQKRRHERERRRRRFYESFGWTEDDYEAQFEKQHGRCAICGKRQEGKRLAADHDHKTNKARGLLCAKCNVGLGMFEDNIELLTLAIDYLTQ